MSLNAAHLIYYIVKVQDLSTSSISADISFIFPIWLSESSWPHCHHPPHYLNSPNYHHISGVVSDQLQLCRTPRRSKAPPTQPRQTYESPPPPPPPPPRACKHRTLLLRVLETKTRHRSVRRGCGAAPGFSSLESELDWRCLQFLKEEGNMSRFRIMFPIAVSLSLFKSHCFSLEWQITSCYMLCCCSRP